MDDENNKVKIPRPHVLMSAQPKLRKAIVSNCDKKHVNCISDCVLSGLNGNIPLTGRDTRKLRNQKVALRKILDMHVPLSGMKRFIVRRVCSY